MERTTAFIKATVTGVALTIALAAFMGCSKKDSAAAGSGQGSGATTSAASGDGGQAVFAANCTRCHSINGVGGGRDLSHVGANPQHTVEWLIAFIKDPQSQKPGTRMPAFAGKIPDSDLQSLAIYLAGLK